MVQAGQLPTVFAGIVLLQELIAISRPLHKTGHLVPGASLLEMVIGPSQIMRYTLGVCIMHN